MLCKKGKDRTNKLDNVNLIYNIPCSSCGLSYVGESKRALSYRIGEHRRSVENNDLEKVILRHCFINGHKMNWNKVSIFDFEEKFWKRLTSEMLHIHLQSKTINKKDDTRSLHNTYISVLDNMKRNFQ